LHKGPALPVGDSQATANPALTEIDKSAVAPENPNLVSGLFFESGIDADLRTVIERWDELSVELRQAIVKMVRQRIDLQPFGTSKADPGLRLRLDRAYSKKKKKSNQRPERPASSRVHGCCP